MANPARVRGAMARKDSGVIEACYSLRRAAAILGVAKSTLKIWLAEEGWVMPQLPKGARAMIRESQLRRVVEKRSLRAEKKKSLQVVA